ncbi:MAG: Spo0E family sporulation regulatory protein-aspartic acid phosphatase [Lachnospiraceae bacterium]|nr:Spo0E family sporulation regulatory protein-aspartic acid phosphatase [Lachnospiraceae bacterium]
MNKKEALKSCIEEERKKLNSLIGEKGRLEDAYRQSLLVDRLIERYMELAD